MTESVTTVAALEAVVGRASPAIDLKVIDHLDRGALHWIAQSPLMIVGVGDGRSVAITLAGGAAGFVEGDATTLRIPLDSVDAPDLIRPGMGIGTLFVAPGIGETLRVNGRVIAIAGGIALVGVEECYVHCAKALIRSAFWSGEAPAEAPDDIAAFVGAARFMALATIAADGRADLSPKGDPAGSMASFDGRILCFADRPGNRRIDSFRNIVGQPHVAVALVMPGSNRIAILRGAAELSTDAAMRERFEVQGKVPAIVTVVAAPSAELTQSAALGRAGVWQAPPAEGIDPAGLLVAHVKRNRDRGLGAKLAGAVLSVPGLMRKGLEKDYKSNLY